MRTPVIYNILFYSFYSSSKQKRKKLFFRQKLIIIFELIKSRLRVQRRCLSRLQPASTVPTATGTRRASATSMPPTSA